MLAQGSPREARPCEEAPGPWRGGSPCRRADLRSRSVSRARPRQPGPRARRAESVPVGEPASARAGAAGPGPTHSAAGVSGSPPRTRGSGAAPLPSVDAWRGPAPHRVAPGGHGLAALSARCLSSKRPSPQAAGGRGVPGGASHAGPTGAAPRASPSLAVPGRDWPPPGVASRAPAPPRMAGARPGCGRSASCSRSRRGCAENEERNSCRGENTGGREHGCSTTAAGGRRPRRGAGGSKRKENRLFLLQRNRPSQPQAGPGCCGSGGVSPGIPPPPTLLHRRGRRPGVRGRAGDLLGGEAAAPGALRASEVSVLPAPCAVSLAGHRRRPLPARSPWRGTGFSVRRVCWEQQAERWRLLLWLGTRLYLPSPSAHLRDGRSGNERRRGAHV